jgi:hypothetical protein
MKIFIICCLLFIHVNMCIFICGFRVSIRVSVQVSGIREFSFGNRFSPESVFGSGLGFDFRFWFWVHRDSTRSESDPLPSLRQLLGQADNAGGPWSVTCQIHIYTYVVYTPRVGAPWSWAPGRPPRLTTPGPAVSIRLLGRLLAA